MSYADAGVDSAVDTKGCEDIGIRRYAGLQNRRRKAVECQGDVPAQIPIETTRNPPESRAENASAEEEWETQEEENMGHLVAKFPYAQFGGALPRIGLHDTIFRLAEMIETTLDEKIDRERKAGDPVGEDAIVDIAAGGVVTGEGGRLLPSLASASRVLIVAVREGLMSGDPKALRQKKSKQDRRDALREVEVEAAKAGESMSHQGEANELIQFKC